MKTANEIKEWLRKQSWFGAFVKNVNEYHGNSSEASDIIDGKHHRWTILKAFRWGGTAEGCGFWVDVHVEFIDWYLK